ncbi:hypothetical protein [Streptomyces cinereospinus]|uniref:Uncharacterized protein n=1 Tax=Streptomyces cinereospinus TaxID=285561 RepID=A0ABV5N868_9ACTN
MTGRDAGTHGVAGGANRCVGAHGDAYPLQGRPPARGAACAPRPAPGGASRPRGVAVTGRPRRLGRTAPAPSPARSVRRARRPGRRRTCGGR